MSNKNYKMYICGGYVRDKILGVKSKDIDYAFEFSDETIKVNKNFTVESMYTTMNRLLKEEGFKIHTTHPDCFTTRAKFPLDHVNKGLDADFVMCRKETYLDPNSRKPTVELGTLYDDLLRRDFTVNAIAINEDGVLVDPFEGKKDLENKILRCPIDAYTSFMDDPLRMIRALRFSLTKGLTMSADIRDTIEMSEVWEKFDKVVSQERVVTELETMFKFDTLGTMEILSKCNPFFVKKYIFKDNLWLKPTTKKIKK